MLKGLPYGRECSLDMRSPRLRTQCRRAGFKCYYCMSFGTNGPPENLILVSPFHKKSPAHDLNRAIIMRFYSLRSTEQRHIYFYKPKGK
jgi:hypothetical protein